MASCGQIDGLLQAYIDGELSPAETVVLEQHLSECRACNATLNRQRASCALLFEALGEHRLQGDLTAAVMAHLPEMELPVHSDHDVTWRTKHPKQRFWGTSAMMPVYAAVVMAVLGLAIVFSWPGNNESIGLDKIGMVMFARGQIFSSDDSSIERRAVTLRKVISENERLETAEKAAALVGIAGPTQLKVDENSRVKISDERQLNLETGRIWLSVAKDKRLFRVITPRGLVTVFGTVFSVEVNPEATIVTVEEGEVTVENDTRFTTLKPNQRVVVTASDSPLIPISVDARSLMAWAQEIQPDEHALMAFNASIKPRQAGRIPAIQVFVVPTWNRPIHSITFEWKPDKKVQSYAGYFIYVSDDHMTPLFRGHIEAQVFSDPSLENFELAIPPDVAVTDVTMLHIDIVPDHSTGNVETPFTEIFALTS